MADKQTFLEELKSALKERDISDVDAAPYLERFDKFYDRMSAEAENSAIPNDVAVIADNIAAQISDSYDNINRLAERTMTVETVTDTPLSDSDAALQTALEADEISEGSQIDDEIIETSLPPEIIDSSSISSRLPDYIEEEPIPNSKIFWILFAVSAPLWIPLGIVILAIFAAAWVTLAALMVGAIASMVALVSAGSAISLVGIVYGIVQLFISLPVGLYELGLGVMIAGAVMLFGILLYNFAVQLVPWLIKLVWKLLGFSIKRLKIFFNFLRRECAKL